MDEQCAAWALHEGGTGLQVMVNASVLCTRFVKCMVCCSNRHRDRQLETASHKTLLLDKPQSPVGNIGECFPSASIAMIPVKTGMRQRGRRREGEGEGGRGALKGGEQTSGLHLELQQSQRAGTFSLCLLLTGAA